MEQEDRQWERALKCARFTEISVFAERLMENAVDVRISRNRVLLVKAAFFMPIVQSEKNLM